MNPLTELVDELRGVNGPGEWPTSWVEPGTVLSVTAGAAEDGNALAEVTWRGLSVEAAYLSTYTPVVGHVVLLLVQPPQLTILGRVVGTPPEES
jgi:hypothetical protein